MKDFYYILGTASNANATEIESAYQKLARKFMDEQDDFMDAHFREIAEAYDILRDDRRRRKYDAAFRRSQRRYYAAFRLKYLNIALTLTFLVVTALFAGYVIRSIQGHPKKIISKPQIQPAVIAAAPVHAKKHHKAALAAKPATVIKAGTDAPRPAPRAIPVRQSDSVHMVTLHANVTGIIYLHELPDYASPLLVKIPNATPVRVLKKGDAWYKVSYNGQEGYVIKGAVER
jgi:hypothetical protein